MSLALGSAFFTRSATVERRKPKTSAPTSKHRSAYMRSTSFTGVISP